MINIFLKYIRIYTLNNDRGAKNLLMLNRSYILIFRIERRGRPQQAQNTCLKPDGKMMQDEVLKED